MDTLGDVRCDSDEDPNGDSKWGSGPFWGADLGELFGGPFDQGIDVPGHVPTHCTQNIKPALTKSLNKETLIYAWYDSN